MGQAVLSQILQGVVKGPDQVAKGLTPPPIDTGDQVEEENNASTSTPDLAALEERLEQIAYQEQISQANRNATDTQRQMQRLIADAQSAFKPGAPVF